VQELRVRHEVRAEHHHAVVFEVPDGQQGAAAVAALVDLLFREEANVLRVPDLQVVQAVAMVFAVGFVGLNLIVDILYAYLDPRIRYG